MVGRCGLKRGGWRQEGWGFGLAARIAGNGQGGEIDSRATRLAPCAVFFSSRVFQFASEVMQGVVSLYPRNSVSGRGVSITFRKPRIWRYKR